MAADQRANDLASHVSRCITGQAVDAFLDQLGAPSVEVQRVATGIPLEEDEAQLEEYGRT